MELQKAVEEVLLPGYPRPEQVAEAVRKILTKPHIHRIVIEPGRPIKVWWRKKPGEMLMPEANGRSPHDIIREIELREFPPYPDNPTKTLFRAVRDIQMERLIPGYSIVGPGTILRRWLQISPGIPQYNRLLGMEVLMEESYDPEVLVVVGVPHAGAELESAALAIKINMEEPDAD